MKQNLFFNILTFDWPKGPVNLYYSRTNQGTGQELYFTLFPNEVEQIFPGIVRNSTNKIYTSFGYPAEGGYYGSNGASHFGQMMPVIAVQMMPF